MSWFLPSDCGVADAAAGTQSGALREDSPLFRVKVDLVVLNVAVTDRRGRYIRDLTPDDFRVFEDGIPQQIAHLCGGQ